jgi:hypothetical protein
MFWVGFSLAHTFYNVLVFSDFGQPLLGKSTIQVALWAVLAYVLFLWWPVKEEDEPGGLRLLLRPNLRPEDLRAASNVPTVRGNLRV